ncbi:hypothetical protein QCA50_021210, partial [Cerrena zonata]
MSGSLGNDIASEHPTKEAKLPSFASDEVLSNHEKDGSPETVTFPEGGVQAWLAVMGGFLTLFASFGIINAYGVFQEYYSTTLLTNTSSSVISLIGSLQLFILYGLSPIIGRIFDTYGPSILLPLGSVIIVLSLMLLSLCQAGQTYQFYLCHGVLFGIGNALVFTPAVAITSHWFKRKRAYVIGIVTSGSAVGGIVYPIVLQRLISSLGFGWAVRVSAFITLACLSVASLTIRTNLPLKKKLTLAGAVDLTGFTDLRYVLATVGAFLGFYALFVPFFYIESFGNLQGIDPSLKKYLL